MKLYHEHTHEEGMLVILQWSPQRFSWNKKQGLRFIQEDTPWSEKN